MDERDKTPESSNRVTRLADRLGEYFAEFKRLSRVEGYPCQNPSINTLGAHTFDREGEAFQLYLENNRIEVYDRRTWGFLNSFASAMQRENNEKFELVQAFV